MQPIPFIKTPGGLVAQNRAVRLTLSPVGGRISFESDTLSEGAECNLLVRRLRGRGDLRLLIDGRDAASLGFLCEGRALWGRIDTGNRPGRIRFCVRLNGREALRAELDVRPAGLHYETHFRAMRMDLERICRALAYAPPEGARVAAVSGPGGGAPLDFLQIANVRLERLCLALRAILERPDRRLASERVVRPVSLARGHDPDALASILRSPAVWTPLPDGPTRLIPFTVGGRRIGYTALRETRRRPVSDTPANRHIVSALDRLARRAGAVARSLGPAPGLAPYRDLCARIRARILRISGSAVFRNVPPAAPAEPFPARLDVRYAAAFAHLRELLKALLPCTGGPFDLAYKDTALLYEYWTWLTLTEAFIALGLTPDPGAGDRLFKLSERALAVRPVQGEASAIDLADPGGGEVRVIYNRTFAAAEGRALTHDLRPDIVVERTGPDGARRLFAFDAKYRRERSPDGCCIPLREDIDKMHAYRDAIGQVSPEGFERALRAAVILFPAPNEPAYLRHRFRASLAHGIGGLPLLPGDPDTLRGLRAYLQKNILRKGEAGA